MKLSTHIFMAASAVLALVVALDELAIVSIESSPIIAKAAIGLSVLLIIVAFFIWFVKERPAEK
ncbi:hypothetical protein [Thalassotalea marina]|uniref:Uncharacterized protein n=1 Tax=Thalassotalea marina TaxID=1673741 RepID=A0A919EPW0_9GAMM|nr:hypothetical protein [Thalassotalea marina]GHG07840.1 hypothetical protein GCM10017161_42000 [Thalassotalea marina]